MMKVTIDGREYQAATAVALIDEIKDIHFAATKDTDAEGYIAIQQGTHRRMMERELELPDGDTEARALAMFKAIAALGSWGFKEE